MNGYSYKIYTNELPWLSYPDWIYIIFKISVNNLIKNGLFSKIWDFSSPINGQLNLLQIM